MLIEVFLPFPISMNAIWRGRQRGVYRSPRYQAWSKQAGLAWLEQKPVGTNQRITGTFSAHIVLYPPDKRRRDLDNPVKVVLDFAKHHGLISDDHLCQKLLVEWGVGPTGCRLVLNDYQP